MDPRYIEVKTSVGMVQVSKSRSSGSGGGLPVIFQAKAANRKISPVDQVDNETSRLRPVPRAPFCCSTYAAISVTCPSRCTYKGHGCFVEAGFTRHMMMKLDKSAAGMTGLQVARIEAAAIDQSFRDWVPDDGARGGRDLRLHVGGDVGGGSFGARVLGAAAERWLARGGGRVWTYTHKWKHIPRPAFGPISVLASIERPRDARDAIESGYAPALTVDRFDGTRAFDVNGVKIVPCAAETTGTTCVECRMCLDRDLVRAGTGIAFALHGPLVDAARRRLMVLQ